MRTVILKKVNGFLERSRNRVWRWSLKIAKIMSYEEHDDPKPQETKSPTKFQYNVQ